MVVVDLAQARAERSNDALDWTPLQALEQTIERIKTGELAPDKIYIAMGIPDEDGDSFSWVCAGMNALETIGLLTSHINLRCERLG